jgi:hypothetical protein
VELVRLFRRKEAFLKTQWADGTIPLEDYSRALGEVGVWRTLAGLAEDPDLFFEELSESDDK